MMFSQGPNMTLQGRGFNFSPGGYPKEQVAVIGFPSKPFLREESSVTQRMKELGKTESRSACYKQDWSPSARSGILSNNEIKYLSCFLLYLE
jgi:hypothetical protein